LPPRKAAARAAAAEEPISVEPTDETVGVIGQPPGRPLAFRVRILRDPQRVLYGSFQARLTDRGLTLSKAGDDDLLLPLGTPARYMGGNCMAVRHDGRNVVLAVTKFGAWRAGLARDLAGFLNGDRGALAARKYRLPWYVFLPALLPLGIPLLARGTWVWAGLAVAVVLAAGCAALPLAGWRPALRVGSALVLGAAGYLGALACLAIGLIVSAAGTLAWQDFSSPEGRFSVTMPGTPQQSRYIEGRLENQVQVHQFQVLVHSRDVGYHVHYFDLPAPVREGPFFARLHDSILSDFPNGRLTNERQIEANGHRGREYIISIPPQITVVRRIFVAGNRIYFATVSGSNLNVASPDVNRFFDSFKISDPAAPPIEGPAKPAEPAVPAKPRDGPEPPPATQFPGLIGYWPFDEGRGTRAGDASGKGHDGTLRGGTWVKGVRGQALRLNGAPDHVEYGAGPGLNFARGARFTFAGWVQTAAPGGVLVSQRDSRHGSPVIDVFLSNGQVTTDVRDDDNETGSHARIMAGPAVNDGAWHHFAVSRGEGGRVTLFVDGAAAGEADAPQAGGAITTDLRAFGCELYWQQARMDPQYLRGGIDEFCAFDRALSPEEIKSLAGLGPRPAAGR
jgi:hypothetical protein